MHKLCTTKLINYSIIESCLHLITNRQVISAGVYIFRYRRDRGNRSNNTLTEIG